MPSSPSPEHKRKSEDSGDAERRNKRRRKENREIHKRAQQEYGNVQNASGRNPPAHTHVSQQTQAARAQDTPVIDRSHEQRKVMKAEKRDLKLEKKRQKERGWAADAPGAEGSARPQKASANVADPSQANGQGVLVKSGRKKRRKHRKSKVEKSRKRQVAAEPNGLDLAPSGPLWSLSEPVGSRLINVPPKLSNDEE